LVLEKCKDRRGNPRSDPGIWQVGSSSIRPTEKPLEAQCLYFRLSALVQIGTATKL
jgi:hypothetical protein